MSVRGGNCEKPGCMNSKNRCGQSLCDFHQEFPLSIGAPTVLGFDHL